MIITWRTQTGFGSTLVGIDLVHVWSGRNTAPNPPVTGVVPDKISLGYLGGVSVRSVPSLGSTGGNGVA